MPGSDLSGMYEQTKILREQPRLLNRVNEIYTKAFQPNLSREEERALSGVRFELPSDGDPVLGYYSNYQTKAITMSAPSLLFFEDLCTAYAWLYVNQYRLETIEEYFTMLKYKTPAEFGGHYLPPLAALHVPQNALDDSKVAGLAFRFRNTGWAFIMGHELGHIRFQHKFYSALPASVAQANEEQADRFALELMRRVSEIPMGALLFFQSGVYYFANRADFESDQAWKDYLSKTARHPLTSRRLRSLSESVRSLATDFARGQPNQAQAASAFTFIGAHFAEFADYLDDSALQRALRARAEKRSVSSLVPRRTAESVR